MSGEVRQIVAKWGPVSLIACFTAAIILGILPRSTRAQTTLTPDGESMPMQGAQFTIIRTIDDLTDLTGAQLDALYRQGSLAAVPTGKVRGVALYPDKSFARARSRAARVAWQGKVFDPASGTAVNRFFGLRVIRGDVYPGSSWLDGGPALILDYEHTSRLYGDYRDEIRQVAPGVFLGLMYDRTVSPPGFKMYFAFAAD